MKKKPEKEEIDPVVKEFEGMDIGPDLNPKQWVQIRAKRKIPTSLLLDPEMIDKLKEKAGRKGLSYLALMKMIVYENMGRY
ncbi:MAG: hypothetical protein A3J74_10455 [Elusimicrobia bacterium RIFCSPHIGHO2_02_FULL_57_9]|nr:MAG: hypothetical protein A3J74_10455 [Elusimicrobia bacterium RIFCSPHIGHO2_02_FULL_57_9]